MGSASDDSSPLPIVAAVQLPSNSRVVAVGHEGITSGCCRAGDGWDRLTVNAFRWLAATKQQATPRNPTIRLAGIDAWGYADAMTAIRLALQERTMPSGYKPTVTWRTMSPAEFAAGGSAQVDVFWIDSYTEYSDEEVAAILAFMELPGKGLMVAGHIWYQSYSRPNANIVTDYAVNRVLWPLGLLITPQAADGPAPRPATPPPEWPLFNSFNVATRLVEARTGGRTFTDVSLYPAANAGLKLMLTAMPTNPAAPVAIALPNGTTATTYPLKAAWDLLLRARSTSGPGVGPSSPLRARTAYPGDVLDVAMDAWTVRTGALSTLRASRSAALFPGLPSPANARPGTLHVTVGGTYTGVPDQLAYTGAGEDVWRSTGAYAQPGAEVVVRVWNASAVARGLSVQVGAHTDDLNFKNEWLRVPTAVSRFALDAENTTAGNPLGGLIFVLVPKGSALGNIRITLTNVLRSPYYKLGSTSLSAWTKYVRAYPGPWAELDSGKLVIMVPSAAIRSLADPAPVLTFWNRIMDSMAYLANMPRARPRTERFLLDADISGGWMHSGYPVMAYNDSVAVWPELLDVDILQAKGAWGPFHELGHNHQWRNMEFKGTTESFVNLFSVYAMETVVNKTKFENGDSVRPAVRSAARAKYLADGANWQRDWDVWIALDTYLQLKEGFGWSFYRRVYAAYKAMPAFIEDEGERVQTWIRTTSRVAGRNLAPFFTSWGFPVTQATRDAVESLPAWAANPMKRVWPAN